MNTQFTAAISAPSLTTPTFEWEVRNTSNAIVASGTGTTISFTPIALGIHTLRWTVTSAGQAHRMVRQLNVLAVPTIEVDSTSVQIPEGGNRTVRVRLNRAPSGPVTVSVARSGDSDLDTSASSLSFNSTNWQQWQNLSITAAADQDAIQGVTTFTLSSPGWKSASVTAKEIDSQRTFMALSNNVAIAELVVNEAGQAALMVRLAGQPEADTNVLVGVDGIGLVLLSPQSLAFSSSNWNVAQEVLIAASNDVDAMNGTGSISLSATGWTGMTIPVSVADDDRRILMTGLGNLAEGQSANYSVTLAGQPSSDVTLSVALVNASGLKLQSSQSVTFSPSNWNVPQQLTIFADQDVDAQDGSGLLTASAFDWSVGIVSISALDDDRLIFARLETDRVLENSELAYMIQLAGRPDSTVTVTTTSIGSLGLSFVAGQTLVFTPNTWQEPQVVRVRASADADANEDTAMLTSSAIGWSSTQVELRQVDLDRRILVDASQNALSINEGGSRTVGIRLAASPATGEVVTVGIRRDSGDRDLNLGGRLR